MGLEEIVADILRKANSDREAILAEGRAKAAQILANAKNEIREREAQAAQDNESVRSASEKKEIADAELSCKKELQDVKKELIGAAYDGLKRKISLLGEAERKRILAGLFEKGRKELGEIGAVYVAGRDLKIALALFRAKKIAVKEKNILGGIIAESEDAKILADYSFDSIIESMRASMIKDVSRIIF